MQSLVPSLTPNNLIPFTIYFSFVYLTFDKKGPLRICKKKDTSGLAKTGPLRIGKIRTPRIGKIVPFRIGKISTLPDWQN